jgi:hypothetical protein
MMISIKESSLSFVTRENKKPTPMIVKMGRMVFEIKSSVPWGIWSPIKEYQITRISDGEGQLSEGQT